MLQMLLRKGRCELSLTPLLTRPLTKEGGSPYETHRSIVGHHGPDPAGGKRGGSGGHQDRHRWPRHPHGDQWLGWAVRQGGTDRIDGRAGNDVISGGPGDDNPRTSRAVGF